MLKQPCIRGLAAFKKGCPRRPWSENDPEGCPAWLEYLVTPKGEPLKQKDKKGNCADLWAVEFQLTALGLLEGNQQAVESFRNNMTEGNFPKPDPAVLRLVQIFEEHQRVQLAIASKNNLIKS
jgi:hypothetical protein